jgi:osmotically-inducible protein OsmY
MKEMSRLAIAPALESPARASDVARTSAWSICSGQSVWCGDRRVGRVTLIRATADGQVSALVVRRGMIWHRDVLVPIAWVAWASERRVLLSVTRAALDSLPAYYDDRTIADAIGRALSADPRLRALGDDDIGVAVDGGAVELRGHVSGSDHAFRASQIARAIPGVLRVQSRIVDDGALTMAVAQALGVHAATRTQQVCVAVRHGVVQLRCAAVDMQVRVAAQSCAAATPHVRGIVNMIQAPGVALGAQAHRVLQPRIGQPIDAPGIRVGVVERVIISLPDRAVTAVVARGMLAGPACAVLLPQTERRVIIPIGAVRLVTQGAVLVGISGDAVAACDNFEPTRFVAPAPSWEPPYPYRSADVLLARAAEPERVPPALLA